MSCHFMSLCSHVVVVAIRERTHTCISPYLHVHICSAITLQLAAEEETSEIAERHETLNGQIATLQTQKVSSMYFLRCNKDGERHP